jgi:pentatricopeptide repeat protein
VVSYTTVLHTHAREGNIQAAEKSLEHIGEKGVEKRFKLKCAGPCVCQGCLELLRALGSSQQSEHSYDHRGALKSSAQSEPFPFLKLFKF